MAPAPAREYSAHGMGMTHDAITVPMCSMQAALMSAYHQLHRRPPNHARRMAATAGTARGPRLQAAARSSAAQRQHPAQRQRQRPQDVRGRMLQPPPP